MKGLVIFMKLQDLKKRLSQTESVEVLKSFCIEMFLKYKKAKAQNKYLKAKLESMSSIPSTLPTDGCDADTFKEVEGLRQTIERYKSENKDLKDKLNRALNDIKPAPIPDNMVPRDVYNTEIEEQRKKVADLMAYIEQLEKQING